MKNLIARIDAIEKGKKYISESAAPVVEYKGGTDAEKIKNWQKHIDQFKEKGMYKAADDAEQSAKRAQPGFKPARSRDKPTKEGSIARALMKEFGVYDDIRPVNEFSDKIGNYFRQNAADYKARQASGELPPDGWNQETDGPWYGKNPNAEPVRDGSGQPVRVASGGNLQTTSPQGQRKTGDQWNPANAGGHAQGFNNDPSGPGLPTTIGSPAPMVVPPGINPETGDPYTPLPPKVSPLISEPPGTPEEPAATGGQNSPLGPAADQQALNRAQPATAGSKDQIASIMNMQRELGVTPDGKIGPKTRDAMARKPEIAAKYAGELGGAKQYPGAKPPGGTAGAQKATQWNPANAGGHAQGFNNDPSGPGLPTTIGSPAPMVVPPGPQPGTGDANVAQAMANQPATNGGQNVVPGKTGPNGEPIQTSQGRPGYYDAKTRKWTPVKEGKVNIPEDDRILNMIRSIKI